MRKNARASKPAVPALVLGADITALGVIRSLARKRIRTYFISDKKDFVRYCRWTIPVLLSMDSFPSVDDLAGHLEGLDIARAVIFPCSDSFLKAVSGLPPRLASRFPSSLPPGKALEILIDKGKFAAVLDEVGIPHPETVIIESREQLRALGSNHFHHHFLKPCRSKEFQQRFHTKGFRVSGLEDALDKYEKIRRQGQSVMLQEYIPGSADRHYFVDGFIDREKNIRALFARRRERIFPADFGNSSYCVSVPLGDVKGALESVRKLFAHLGYRGIFSAEFKLDERDSLFKILEVNARPWWYIEFATACGVDTCQMAYRDALELSVASVKSYREGKGCMYGLNDFFAAWRMFLEGRLSPASWALEFLISKKPVFSWDDPCPAIYNFLERPYHYLKNTIFKSH